MNGSAAGPRMELISLSFFHLERRSLFFPRMSRKKVSVVSSIDLFIQYFINDILKDLVNIMMCYLDL